jgi:hypothetical protein
MMRQPVNSHRVLPCIAVALCILNNSAAADPYVMTRAGQVLQGQIIGGVVASRADWPATLTFTNGAGWCTATIIGPQVVLTAAHCIPNGGSARIQLMDPPAPPTQIVCDHHPNYPADISVDFALCKASIPLNIGNSKYEVVNVDPTIPRLGSSITLLGFGCRTPGGNDQSFGVLYVGTTTLQTRSTDNYLVTSGGAALCYGDSGGGAFAAIDQFQLMRRLVAVNSRGDISTYSWLSATASGAFATWATDWSTQKGVKICGLDPTLSAPCHQ